MSTPTGTEAAREDTNDASAAPEPGRLAPYLPGRREALFLVGGLLGGGLAGAGTVAYRHRIPAPVLRDDEQEVGPREGQEMLTVGNERYRLGAPEHPDQSLERREAVSAAQAPFAAVLACADSRVPPEVIFDQGVGDLFVVRSAGQVVDHAVLGSLQYGVEHLSTPLLVVLGHSQCGAVKATVESIEKQSKPSGTDIDALVAAITPAVEEAEEIGAKKSNLVSVSIDLNVERVVEQLKKSPVLREAVALRKVKIVGAVYSLRTGEIDWL